MVARAVAIPARARPPIGWIRDRRRDLLLLVLRSRGRLVREPDRRGSDVEDVELLGESLDDHAVLVEATLEQRLLQRRDARVSSSRRARRSTTVGTVSR